MTANRIFSLKNKTIVVTGGLGKLGKHFSKALASQGARVAIFDLSERVFSDRNICVFKADVTNKSSLVEALRRVEKKWGVPYGLLNAAALDSPPDSPAEENGPFETYPESSWDQVMRVNAKGVFLACQVVGGRMAKAGRGSIVNVNSTYGLVSPDQRIYAYRGKGRRAFYKPCAYSASKSALVNFSRYLATYWASRAVRVNTLTLGGVFNHQDRNFLKGYAARVPMGRMAYPDEYNGAVIFLLSEASSYMTGSNLVIDGGWTAW